MRKHLKKKFGIVALVIAFVSLSNSGPMALAANISRTRQVSSVEYVYDENNRLVEVKKSGKTIAVLSYDKNGNLLSIQSVK